MSGQPPVLRSRGLVARLGGRAVLQGVDLALPSGCVTALIGPNGSGKSTLLRSLAGLLPPAAGSVELEGRPLAALTPRQLARQLAYLPQNPPLPAGMTVRELAGLGRFPHLGLFARPRGEDRAAVDGAIAATGLAALAEVEVARLSGGERQRAWIAMALAQGSPILLLDEPTSFLDLGHQMEVLELVRRLNRESGLTVLWVLHDLNQAAAYSDRLVLLRGGRLVAAGAPAEVLSAASIRESFGLEVLPVTPPGARSPWWLPAAAVRA